MHVDEVSTRSAVNKHVGQAPVAGYRGVCVVWPELWPEEWEVEGGRKKKAWAGRDGLRRSHGELDRLHNGNYLGQIWVLCKYLLEVCLPLTILRYIRY